MGYMLVFVYVNLMLSKMNCVEQRFWLSVIGILRYMFLMMMMMMMTVMVMIEISKMNCVKQSSNFRFISMEFQVISIFIWLRPGLLVFKFCIYLLVRLMLQGMLSLKLSHSLFERTQTPLSWRSVFKQHQTTWKLWHLLNKVKDHAEIVSFQRENTTNDTWMQQYICEKHFHGKRLHLLLAVWPWEWFWVMDSVQCADFSIQLRIQVRQQHRQSKNKDDT